MQAANRMGQGKKSYLVFVRDLPVEAVPERMAGLHVRDPSRIENGEQALTHKALLALARAHGQTPDEYLSAIAERM